MAYPKIKYSQDHQVLVRNKREEDGLCGRWFDTPDEVYLEDEPAKEEVKEDAAKAKK